MEIQSTQPQNEPHYDEPATTLPSQELIGPHSPASETDDTPDNDASTTDGIQVEASDISCLSIDDFLQSVERKAFVMARYALRNEDDALDAVQDAMLKLCERYIDRPHQEWPPLFDRILQNGITDRCRPRGMQRLKRWVLGGGDSSSEMAQDDSMRDTMDSLPSELPGPQDELSLTQRTGRINELLAELPARQREVFLLRSWQGLSVKEAAEAMNISDGSVKTHLSRAVTALRERLQEQEQ